MSFTSPTFWAFFALVFIAYWIIPKHQGQNIFLLAASYVFYGWLAPGYAILLGISTLADFQLAHQMRKHPERANIYLALSLILNLGVLAFFKYYGFFEMQVAEALSRLGVPGDGLFLRILLPAGLSFYTLKKLAYMIDVARGQLAPTPSLVDFALYIAFFPQLLAGPIDRPQTLLPQIETMRRWKADYFYAAWPLIVMGLFKKLVIADSIASMTERVFHLEEPTLLLAMTGALAFTVQILADFSAYTDLARGIAFLLGFETSENFKSPYASLTPTEFWSRWHMTLSSWLRDYVFFPMRRFLLTRQKQLPRWLVQAVPPLATMLLSGVWHGTGWTYFLWGGMYGLLIVVYQAIGMGGNWRPSGKLQAFFAWLVMFGFIVFGWLLFAAPSLAWVAKAFTQPIAGTFEQQAVALITFSVAVAYSIPLLIKRFVDRFQEDSIFRAMYYAAVTALIFVYVNSSTPDFIYFQF